MDGCLCHECIQAALARHMADQVGWELTRHFDPGAGDDRTVWTSVSPGRTLTLDTLERALERLREDEPLPSFRFPSASEVLAALTPDTPQPSHPWDFARARALLAAGREDDVAAAAAAEVAPVPVDAIPTRPRSFAQWQREAADLLALAERQRR